MQNLTGYKNAGFWSRFLATWVDFLIIYAVVKLAFYALLYSHIYIYFPFEFTFFILGIVYSIIAISLKGQTIGKYLIGISVRNKDSTKLPFYKALLRESVLKIFSGVVLFLGFLWIGFSKKKMAWHDYFCRSKVIKYKGQKNIWTLLALASFLLFSVNYLWNFSSVIIDARKIDLSPASIHLPFMERDPSTVKNVGALIDSPFIKWIDTHAQSPEDYVIQIASTHQITLFGEQHENGDNLLFFNKIIAPLYFKSGVRVIAMEVIPASMNKKADSLVNGKIYDTTLAMEIARSQCWKIWGYKDYWDVMVSVWKLNQSLPAGAQRMRLIGIDNEWLLPNISLIGLSDSKGKTPFWEKFRAVSALKDLPSLAYRDEIMARNIEKEIIDKNQKAVVLIGFNHTLINYTNAVRKDKKIMAVKPRFGVLLTQKYPRKFFQIELYQPLDYNEENKICENSIDNFLDTIMQKRNNQPVGFTIASSPFENIRDSCGFMFSKFPSVNYGDITQGLIFLKPLNKSTRCTWMKGYISNEMFMNYKPMYDLLLKHQFKSADEMNELLLHN